MSSWEWRCSWSSADRRCTNYIWVINNFIAYQGAAYIKDFTVHFWDDYQISLRSTNWVIFGSTIGYAINLIKSSQLSWRLVTCYRNLFVPDQMGCDDLIKWSGISLANSSSNRHQNNMIFELFFGLRTKAYLLFYIVFISLLYISTFGL